ncbi:MAG: LysE family translocator [Paracoccaceae bacterium]|jgi:threonine/homoserine/homoserine lactone efflux protein|nr:LysE family translocator [Paracoccaceae bacterium]MDP7185118.1 LysE family translocator [Paracoccaceae bacterium]
MLETLINMDPWTVASFVGAGVVLNLTPGADVLFTTASGIKGGWRYGVAAAFGITLGSAIHVILAVLGVSAAIAAIPFGLEIIRYLGAAYLAYLAVQAWRAKPNVHQPTAADSLTSAIKRGLITNILNPKVGLFILAFLPQFTDPAIGPVWQQMLFLGVLFILTGFTITALYGVISGLSRNAFQSRLSILNKISALIFGGLAARLVLN